VQNGECLASSDLKSVINATVSLAVSLAIWGPSNLGSGIVEQHPIVKIVNKRKKRGVDFFPIKIILNYS
jgi:hypothetical protein